MKASSDARGTLRAGLTRLSLAAQDDATALGLGGFVDLLPEGNEVVDSGDDRNDGHPVDRRESDEADGDDEDAVEAGEPEPVVPAVGEDGGDDRDHLNNGLELADLGGLDGET